MKLLPFNDGYWELKFTIPIDPKSKKNSQNIIKVKGRPIIVQGAIYKKYEKDCKPYIPKMTPLTCPVNCKYVFYRETKRRVDGANLTSAIDDILVKYKVLEDDNRDIIASHDGTVVLWDKENPRTEVTITPKFDYEQWKERKNENE